MANASSQSGRYVSSSIKMPPLSFVSSESKLWSCLCATNDASFGTRLGASDINE
jgi:hypothetical protein